MLYLDVTLLMCSPCSDCLRCRSFVTPMSSVRFLPVAMYTYSSFTPARPGPSLSLGVTLLVAPRGELRFFVGQRLFVQTRFALLAGVLPGADVEELIVVASCFAVGRLMLDAEVSAGPLLALQRVDAHQLGELEEVGDA